MPRPLTHVRLEPTTAQYLRRCVALAWYCDEARDYESLLRPILRRQYERLRRRARDRGGDPDELIRLAETGSRDPAPAGFRGLPVKSPRVDP